MNIENNFLRFLFEYRKTISGALIAIAIVLGFLVSVFTGVTSKEYELSKLIINLLPWVFFFFFFILLVFYIITGILKSKIEKKESILLGDKDPLEMYSIEKIFPFFSKKYRILYACIATHIALIILICVVVSLFDLEINMDSLMIYLFYIGGPIWILATWKYFNKHLK